MEIDINIDPSLNLENAVLLELLEIWRAQSDGSSMPPWSSFDAAVIPARLLPHLYVIDGLIEKPPRPRWRLLGTHTTAALGRDNTGKYYDEIYSPENANEMSKPVFWVMDKAVPVRLTGLSVFARKDWLRYECVYLPYSDNGEHIDIILGGIVYGESGQRY